MTFIETNIFFVLLDSGLLDLKEFLILISEQEKERTLHFARLIFRQRR